MKKTHAKIIGVQFRHVKPGETHDGAICMPQPTEALITHQGEKRTAEFLTSTGDKIEMSSADIKPENILEEYGDVEVKL